MNLQAYANHRKALGLRGTSHVAVINAIKDQRLTPPAVVRDGHRWVIDAAMADEQWATRTDPSEYGAMGGGTARPIGLPEPALPMPPPPPAPTPRRLAEPPPAAKGAPSLAISKQVRAAYEAKLTELDFKQRNGELVSKTDVDRVWYEEIRRGRDAISRTPQMMIVDIARAVGGVTPKQRAEVLQILERHLVAALEGLANESD